MFEKTLTDVIRGLRANKDNVDEHAQQCIAECRREVAVPSDPAVNAQAVLKLAYFHMMGYDMGWASFHVLKTMSSPVFAHKWIGYLAASLSFSPKTDVLMLTTNLIKKDLNSNSHFETSVAAATLSEIVTRDLAGDLAVDLVAKVTHFNAYTRRRVLLAIYRTALVYPDMLDMALDRLTAPLSASAGLDPAVVSCAVSVICELATASPREYIALAPQLFGLLTSTGNNWTLIKLVKVFARMAELEPRLVKKLAPPLAELIRATGAMSLQHECILAALTGGLTRHPTLGPPLAALCRDKLCVFLGHRDPNLRYVGLVATEHLVRLHPDLVTEALEDAVFDCLDAPDLTIRHRAMDVLALLVTPTNLPDVVAHLMRGPRRAASSDTESDSEEPDQIAAAMDKKTATVILDVCTRSGFALVTDIEWLVATLVALMTHPTAPSHIGPALAHHTMDLALRGGTHLPHLRPLLLAALVPLLSANNGTTSSSLPPPIWSAIVWIAGEFAAESAGGPGLALESLLAVSVPATPRVHATYVHALAKTAIAALLATPALTRDAAAAVLDDPLRVIDGYLASSDNPEAVERARLALAALAAVRNAPSAENLRAVAAWYLPTTPAAALAPHVPGAAAAPTPPFDLTQWCEADARDFFDEPPQPLFAAPSVADPALAEVGEGKPDSVEDLPRHSKSVRGGAAKSKVLAEGAPLVTPAAETSKSPAATPAKTSRARNVLRKGSPADNAAPLIAPLGSTPTSTATPAPLVVKSTVSKSSPRSTRAPPSTRTPTDPASTATASATASTDDMHLALHLAAPRAATAAAFAVPLTVAWTPRHALALADRRAVLLHLAAPAWIGVAGTQDEGVVAELVPGSEAVSKLLLLKLRKAKLAGAFAAANGGEETEIVLRAVDADTHAELARVVLRVELTHVLSPATIQPDEFEARLTGPTAASEFPPTAPPALTAVPYVPWPTLARVARMHLVEVVAGSASLWGKLEMAAGKVCWIAALAKADGEGRIAVQVKAGEAWVAAAVARAVERGVAEAVQAGAL
ncbi:AP-3 complex subunit delta [Blastocladiella emersonii ATCC 22665]|nr:AP-3 complex subunit delta [Blastocladiella emersonii ATCC 22665]